MSNNDADGFVNDDELGSIPKMTPEREDIADRQGRRSFGIRNTRAVSSKPVAGASVNPASNMFLIVLLALFLISVSGGIVYLYKQLRQTQQSLMTAIARVEQLEMRLASTDTSLTKSEVLLGAKIKSMDVLIEASKIEVRKLWSASDKNTKNLQAQNADLQQQKAQIQGLIDQTQQMATQVASDAALLKIVDNTAKESAQRMEIVQESLGDLSTDTKSLKDKQSHLEIDMSKRVTTLEDTAKSTDVFRRNTLDELRKLREELSRQQASSAASAKPTP